MGGSKPGCRVRPFSACGQQSDPGFMIRALKEKEHLLRQISADIDHCKVEKRALNSIFKSFVYLKIFFCCNLFFGPLFHLVS